MAQEDPLWPAGWPQFPHLWLGGLKRTCGLVWRGLERLLSSLLPSRTASRTGVRPPSHILLPLLGSSLGYSHLFLEGLCLIISSLCLCFGDYLCFSSFLCLSLSLFLLLCLSPCLCIDLHFSPSVSLSLFLSPLCLPLSLSSSLPPVDLAHQAEIDLGCLFLRSSEAKVVPDQTPMPSLPSSESGCSTHRNRRP